MISLKIGRRSGRRPGERPPPGALVRVNAAHPLAAHLLFAVPYSEAGGKPQDVTHKTVPTFVGSNAPTWKSGPAGSGFSPGASGGGSVTEWRGGTHLIFDENSSITMFSAFTVDGADTTYRQLLGRDNVSPRRAYVLYVGPVAGLGNRVIEFYFGTVGGSITQVAGATTVPNDPDAFRTAAGVRDRATDTMKVYLNGVQDGSATDTLTGTFSADVGNVGMGLPDGVNVFNGKKFVDYIFNRALTAAEVLSLHKDPWQLFEWDSPAMSYEPFIKRSAVMPVDWAHVLKARLAMPVEWVGNWPVARSAAAPVDWGAMAKRVQAMPVDWQGRLARALTMPVEWDFTPGLLNLFNILRELDMPLLNFFDIMQGVNPLPGLTNTFSIYTVPAGLHNVFNIFPLELTKARGIPVEGDDAAAVRALGNVQQPKAEVDLA